MPPPGFEFGVGKTQRIRGINEAWNQHPLSLVVKSCGPSIHPPNSMCTILSTK